MMIGKPDSGEIKGDNKFIVFWPAAFLILALVYSLLMVPIDIETGGGSCYQGIGATIVRGLAKFCFFLSCMSLVAALKNWKWIARITAILSFIWWTFWSLASSLEGHASGLLYYTPMLFATFITMMLVVLNRIPLIKT